MTHRHFAAEAEPAAEARPETVITYGNRRWLVTATAEDPATPGARVLHIRPRADRDPTDQSDEQRLEAPLPQLCTLSPHHPTVCPHCQQPVTAGQESEAVPNTAAPLGPPVTFHTGRHACRAAFERYRARQQRRDVLG